MVGIKQHRESFEKIVEHLSTELKSVRTGRANTVLVERVMVENYGAMTPLAHVASLSVPDARTIVIAPWDKGVLKEIEKAIVNAHLEVNPVNDGAVIRISIPALTEEHRKNLIKVVGQKVEQSRIALRGVREGIKEQILAQEKAKEITEDDRYTLLEELDMMTKEFTSQLDAVGKAKEEDIMVI